MNELTRRERLELILTYYILWKIKQTPRVVRRVIRYAQPITKVSGLQSLAGSSIADLGTKDHDLLTNRNLDANHLQYLLIDGTRAMTGDFDVATYDVKFNDCLIRNTAPNVLEVTNLAETAFRSMKVSVIYAAEFSGFYDTNMIFGTKAAAGANCKFNTYHGGLQTCAELVSLGLNNGAFRIQRAGDITLLAGKHLAAAGAGSHIGSVAQPFSLGYIAELIAASYVYSSIIGADGDTHFQYTAGSDILAVVDGTDVFYTYPTGIQMEANMLVDCQSNGGELHPARVSNSAEPTPSVHELQIWRDPDDNKTYLIYNDTDEGVRKVEMT